MSQPSPRAEISELVQRLNVARQAYYSSGGQSPLTDAQYDALYQRLQALEAEHPEAILQDSPTQGVGANLAEEGVAVRHQTPMYSLDNLFEAEELERWIARCEKTLAQPNPAVLVEIKIDGLSMSVIYEKGQFQQAITRGNGEFGEDVTENLRLLPGLPKTLAQPWTLELRGEVYMTFEDFAKLNLEREEQGLDPFMNPRNAASGSLRLKDGDKSPLQSLRMWIYDVAQGIEVATHQETLAFLEQAGFPVNPQRKLLHSAAEVYAYCQEWESKKELEPYPVDGMVLKLNDLEARQRMGFTMKSPRWAMAWKFKDEEAQTQLLGIEESVGRTGKVTPVAIVEKVLLKGSFIQRASLHNYDQIELLGLQLYDYVKIAKKGEIIPQIVRVLPELRPPQAQPIQRPSHCPVCGHELVQPSKRVGKTKLKEELEVGIYCPNAACPAQLQGRFLHFVSRAGMDIREIGPALLETLAQEGLIATLGDLYRLGQHRERLIQLEGYGEKSIDKVLAALEKSKRQSLPQFLYALGIKGVGKGTAKALALNLNGIPDLLALGAEELEKVQVGDIVKASLLAWLADAANRALLEDLAAQGVAPTPLEKPSHQPFLGQSVVITGTLSVERKDWQFRLEQAGFKVVSAVSSKTHYLLAGESAGSKLKKAQELGIPILSEGEMEQLLQAPL